MASFLHQAWDVLSLIPSGGPGLCNISVTNVCNATCDFCNYARDKGLVGERVWIDLERTKSALDILHGRGIRYLTFTGGEPLLHKRLPEMIAHAANKGMRPSVVTNGSPLSGQMIARLVDHGLGTLFISIDAPSAGAHEKNRGLPRVCERIAEANRTFAGLGVKTVASVTINKLIGDYGEMIAFLEELGFEAVTFTYPKRSLASGSLVFSETSTLIDYAKEELIAVLREIKRLKGRFPILNPDESLSEMIRFLNGERQRFPCYGGHKYFWLTKDFEIYRCDFWPQPMCSVEAFAHTPPVRDDCTRCMSVCYRDSSVLLHFVVSLGDAFGVPPPIGRQGLWTRSTYLSIRTLIGEWRLLRKLAATGTRSAPHSAHSSREAP